MQEFGFSVKVKDMKYIFILGNHPSLSLAELLTVFSTDIELVNNNIAILDTKKDINASQIIQNLGGTIKIGLVIKENSKDFAYDSKKIVLGLCKKGEKFSFGLSCYGDNNIYVKNLGINIKKALKNEGFSIRFVESKEKVLSSVIVEQNKLLKKGIEIISFKYKGQIFLAKTLAVQPFKSLSFRDFGRPARDDRSGMIPPKLAQIMINIATGGNRDIKILDPFCGSGTILSEALLMNHNVFGSDISKKAIEDSQNNLEWIKEKYDIQNSYELLQINATEISKIIIDKFNAIVTEPFLGPQRGQIDIKKTIIQLNKLYSQSIEQFLKILNKNGRVVMVWPVFVQSGKKYFLNPDIKDFKIANIFEKQMFDDKLYSTQRQTMIYGRQGQKVLREIIILDKK